MEGTGIRLISEHQQRVVALIKRLVLRAYIDGMRGKMKPDIQYSDTRFISKSELKCRLLYIFQISQSL